MPGETKLKPCPFCGGSEIEECDVSGEIWFRCKSCRAGTGIENFAKRDGLIANWNRRTPEPCQDDDPDTLTIAYMLGFENGKDAAKVAASGVSLIHWRRYDGSPETLPEAEKTVVLRFVSGQWRIVRLLHEERTRWWGNMHCWLPMEGEIWAYLPEPPEGMK